MSDLLNHFAALEGLDDRDRAWLTTAGYTLTLTPGQTVIQEGQVLDALYLALSGSLAVSIAKTGNQTETIPQELRPHRHGNGS